MAKCKVCRAKDVELLTRWERIRFWLFERVNYVFFPDDFADLKSGEYTKGFSDGTIDGAKAERNSYERLKELYDPPQSAETIESIVQKRMEELLTPVREEQVISFDKNKRTVYIGGELADPARLANLKQEAEAYSNFELFKVLQETPKALAQRALFVEGDNLDTMKKGRTMLYTLQTQQNIINAFRSYEPRPVDNDVAR